MSNQAGYPVGDALYHDAATPSGTILDVDVRRMLKHVAALEAELREVLLCCKDPTFDDERLDYVEIQVDREWIEKAREVLDG